ncbi:DNA-packaging protein [Rubrimonas cliftonensis]|uniref:Large terminase phage packaging protein n=1 Tax=Rubrimonas cliftonensis TaxID=89524 RepID=A0A1H3ZHV4_9RHOB|nr:terminase family protein [Rubrimonas cliftonensis]SEA23313.1 Large terminase phage packaging protein [Rubrimonas cliftonensis]
MSACSAPASAPSTSTPRGLRSLADSLASLERSQRDAFIRGLSANAQAALPYLFEVWAHPDHQLAPEGEWTTWVAMGGRGAGKTRAGAEWLRAQMEGATPTAPGRAKRAALVAETWAQARDVMVFGDSGIMTCTPPDRRPDYVATRRRLVWANGAEAQLFSAADPESLRGPQFDCAWSDELAKWRRGQQAWDMLQFGLRLGTRPRQVVTTTPRDSALLRRILEDPSTVATTAPTAANRAYLARDFLEKITSRYRGTAQGRQELDGELLTERPGAMFTRAGIERHRVARAPAMDRVVIGVDPPVTSHAGSDACGIVVAGRAGDACYVLADRSAQGLAPAAWAALVAEAARSYCASRIVAEVNQGGDLVAEMIRRIDPVAPVSTVRATTGKAARAEPVSLLYEQGRVRHVGCHPALEDELCAFGGPGPSPDRVDALVWAVVALMHEPEGAPRVRRL